MTYLEAITYSVGFICATIFMVAFFYYGTKD